MKKLTKGKNKILDGVCSGFADYFEIDITVVRLIFTLIGLICPISIFLFYIISMIVIPKY